MGSLHLPYLADVTIGGKRYKDLDVTKLSSHTCLVRRPDGGLSKCHLRKRGVLLKFMSTEMK